MGEDNKKIILIFVVIAIIITGLFSSYNLLITRGYSSKVYGTLGLNKFINKVNEEELEFIFDIFETSNGSYLYTKSTETQITDLSVYSVTFNGYKAVEETQNANSYFGKVYISFLNYQNNVIGSSYCQISLSLREEMLTMAFSVNDYATINLWTDYLTTNKLKIKLVEKVTLGNIEQTTIETIPNNKVIYTLNNGNGYSLYHINDNCLHFRVDLTNQLPIGTYLYERIQYVPSNHYVVYLNGVGADFIKVIYLYEFDTTNVMYKIIGYSLYVETTSYVINNTNLQSENRTFGDTLDLYSTTFVLLNSNEPLDYTVEWNY